MRIKFITTFVKIFLTLLWVSVTHASSNCGNLCGTICNLQLVNPNQNLSAGSSVSVNVSCAVVNTNGVGDAEPFVLVLTAPEQIQGYKNWVIVDYIRKKRNLLKQIQHS